MPMTAGVSLTPHNSAAGQGCEIHKNELTCKIKWLNFNSDMSAAKLYILVTISAVFKRRNGEWSVEVGAVGPPILQDAHPFTQALLKH